MNEAIPGTLTLIELGKTGGTANKNLYVECKTDAGVVAFWGKHPHTENMDLIRRIRLPARIRCGCIPSRWDHQHALWVPQTAEIVVEDEPAPIRRRSEPDRDLTVTWRSPLQKGLTHSTPCCRCRDAVEAPSQNAASLVFWRGAAS